MRVITAPGRAVEEALPQADVTDGDRFECIAQPPVRGAGAVVNHIWRKDKFDRLYVQRPRRWLAAVLAAYVVVATLFAIRTPSWQAPDEPAHYNYIAFIASTGQLPTLREGDYDQDYLSLLLNTNFASRLPISRLRYENYQPPLYYLLATPVFRAFGGNLIALRLFGAGLGFVSILLLYRCLEIVFPGKTLIPLGAAAFAGLLPMHVAMLAAINNDSLAGLLLMAAMLVLLYWLRRQFYKDEDGRMKNDKVTRRQGDKVTEKTYPLTLSPPHLVTPSFYIFQLVGRQPLLLLLGILLGLGMVTKIYAYVLLPISLVAVVSVLWLQPRVQTPQTMRTRGLDDARSSLRDGRRALSALRASLWIVVPALLIPLPMWVRNMYLYGGWDILALAWHDVVVEGQPRTSQFIETYGWVEYSERAYSFTFKSFWGVFGWMGVFMDERIYTALLIFSGVIFMGILWATVRFISGGSDTDMDFFQLSVLFLLGVILLAVTASYLWYNMKYVQHQGRYFFWGLLPIGVIFALGWREVLHPLQGMITGMLAAVLAGAMLGAGYVTGGPDNWTLLSVGTLALVLLLQPLLLSNSGRYRSRWLPSGVVARLEHPLMVRLFGWLRLLVWALPFLLLCLLDLLIPSIFIIPQLTY